MTEPGKVETGRVALAWMIDMPGGFPAFGYVIGLISGGSTDTGFRLRGWTVLLPFAVPIAYVVGFDRYGGGTVGGRIMRVAP